MEEERKDMQEALDTPVELDLPEELDLQEKLDLPDEPAADPEPVRETPASTPGSRLERKNKRGKEPRTHSRDRALMGFVEQVENENTREYIQTRVMEQMQWYAKKSGECKRQYQYCMTAAIILGALIPVASVMDEGGSIWIRILIALLGSSVTAVNAYLSLQNAKDLWITYRNTRENLLRTLYYYFSNSGSFKTGTQEEKDARLVERCEAELAIENGTWRSVQESQGTVNVG